MVYCTYLCAYGVLYVSVCIWCIVRICVQLYVSVCSSVFERVCAYGVLYVSVCVWCTVRICVHMVYCTYLCAYGVLYVSVCVWCTVRICVCMVYCTYLCTYGVLYVSVCIWCTVRICVRMVYCTYLCVCVCYVMSALRGAHMQVMQDLHPIQGSILSFFLFFSRATDQQYGIRTFEDNSKLHGHTNEHVQLIRRGTSRD